MRPRGNAGQPGVQGKALEKGARRASGCERATGSEEQRAQGATGGRLTAKAGASRTLEGCWEVCLSVRGLLGLLGRCPCIRYEGFDHQCQPMVRVAHGFHSRVVLHECDHMIGRLYQSRITDFSKLGFMDVMFP
ncbi:hypothetical protein EWW49_28495, partial [Pseudomonas syringae]